MSIARPDVVKETPGCGEGFIDIARGLATPHPESCPTTQLGLILVSMPGYPGRAFMKSPRNSRADILKVMSRNGAYPGVEAPLTPDEPGDSTPMQSLQGLRVYDWRRVRRVRRADSVFFAVAA